MDFQGINATFDLPAIVSTTVKGQGKWRWGPCPFCGGKDRFVLLHSVGGWRWLCRVCGDGKYHTVIDYVMKRDGTDAVAAFKALGGSGEYTSPAVAPVAPRVDPPLSTEWVFAAGRFVAECKRALYAPANSRALDYLLGRGLGVPVLVDHLVGFNPADRWVDGAAWGIEGKQFLPRGVVLPHVAPEGVLAIKVRLSSGDKKYTQVKRWSGAGGSLFGWMNLADRNDVVVITEGEFDALYLAQSVGDMAAVVTMGAAGTQFSSLPSLAQEAIRKASFVLTAYDTDEAGENGAAALAEAVPQAQALALPYGIKDVSEINDPETWFLDEIKRLLGGKVEQLSFADIGGIVK